MEKERRTELIDEMKGAFLRALESKKGCHSHIEVLDKRNSNRNAYDDDGGDEEEEEDDSSKIARECIIRKEMELLFETIKVNPEYAVVFVYYLLRTNEQPQYLFTFQRTLQAGYKHSQWNSAVNNFSQLTTTTYHALKLFKDLLVYLASALSSCSVNL